MSELPQGWAISRFSEVLQSIVGGGTPSKANPRYFSGSIPFMTVKDLHERFPKDTIDHISEEAVSDSATSLVPEDTLIVATRMSLGKIARPKFKTAINQDLKALFLVDGLDKTYVEYWWRSQSSLIQSLGTGTTVKGIRLEDIRGLEFPLAPTSEQKRIADKLDTLQARVDATRARLDRIPELLKRFRQSVLAAATSGQLTEEWRQEQQAKASAQSVAPVHHGSDSDLPPPKGQVESLETVQLKEVLHSIKTGPFGSALHKADYVKDGIPIINPMHISQGKIRPSSHMTVNSKTLKKLADFCIETGDVIIGRRGEMGRCAVVTQHESGWLCGTGSMVLKPKQCLRSEYLQLFLSSPNTVKAIEDESVGSTMVNLNQKILL